MKNGYSRGRILVWLGLSLVTLGIVIWLLVEAIPDKADVESIMFLLAYIFIIIFSVRILWISKKTHHGSQLIERAVSQISENATRLREKKLSIRDITDKTLDAVDSEDVKDLVNDLCTIHENGGKVDGSDLRAMIDDRFESEADKALHYLGLFVLLGLLGTVIGLNGSIHHMSGILDENVTAVNAFSPVFNQMKGAFGTTLAGIAATIFFGKLLHSVRGKNIHALEKLEFVIRSRIIPRYRPADDKSLLLEIKEGFLEAIKGFKNLSDEYREQAQTQREVHLRFSQSAATFRCTMDDFKKRTDESVDALKEFKNVATAINNTVVQFASETKEFQTDVKEQFASQTGGMKKMVESNSSLVEQMKASKENEQQLHDAVSTLSERIQKVFDDIAVTIGERLGGLSDSIVGMQESFKDSLNENMKALAGELTQQLSGVASKVDESLSGVAGSVRDGFASVAESVSGQFSGLANKFDGIEGTLRESNEAVVKEFQTRIKEITDEMLSDIKMVSTKVSEGQDIFVGAVGTFEGKMVDWADAAKSESDKVKSFIAAFDKWHKDMSIALEDFKIVLGTRDWVEHIDNVKKARRI